MIKNNPRYRVGLFGNSNCILLDGVASQLRKSNCDVLNFALGGSPTPSHIYQLLSNWDSLKDCDFFVVEPSIIDLRFGENKKSIEYLTGYAQDFICALQSFEKPFYLLDFPWPQNIEKISAASHAWRNIFNYFNGCVVDCYDAISKIASEYSIKDYEVFFRDQNGHLKYEFHEWIVGVLISFQSSSYFNFCTGITIQPNLDFINRYKVINATSLHGDFLLQKRSTSLGSWETVKLKPSKSYQINLEQEYEIIGLMGNFGEMSSSSIARTQWLQNKDIVTISHSNKFLTSSPRGKLTLMFQTFPPGKLNTSNCYEFNLSQDSSVDQQLEFIGFLVKKPSINLNNPDINCHISDNSNLFSSFMRSCIKSHPFHIGRDIVTANSKSLTFDEFKDSLLTAINNNFLSASDFSSLARDLGIFFKRTGHQRISVSIFKGILEESPSSYWVRYNLVVTLIDLGEIQDAICYAHPLIEAPDFSGRIELLQKLNLVSPSC